MFVKAQNGKRFINLANVTDIYSESFNKQESIDRVLILLENKVQEKRSAEIIDGEPPKIIYYQDHVFQIPNEDDLV